MNDNIFLQLQILSQQEQVSQISESRKVLNKAVEYFIGTDLNKEQLPHFAKFRQLELSTLEKAKVFYTDGTVPEEFSHDSYGLMHGDFPVFVDRFVYPVFDVKGDVMGFCGYDVDSSAKYLDSQNYGYTAKSYSCYGMEKLAEYYNNDELVIFVEGIVCCLAAREAGVQALAFLGSQMSPYMAQIVKRFGDRAVVFMDSDEAGTKFRRRIHKQFRCAQSTIAKDLDDSRKVNPDFFNEVKKLRDPFYQSQLYR